jgi:hypothetical protein
MSKHSAHRPPYNTRSSFGVVYPENDIISVLADSAVAEQTVQELRAAGIPYDDIDLATGEQVLGFERQRAHSQGLLGRIARLATVLSEDGRYHDDLLKAARAGGTFVVVHADDSKALEKARPILVAHQPHMSLYYRRGTVEELV